MEQPINTHPFIKVSKPVPQAESIPTQAEVYAYVAEESTTPVAEPKTVGNMNEEEFLELLVKGMIQANRVQASLDESDKPFEREEENLTPIGKVLGLVGDVAHGALDIVEGVARGAVDIVTFGKAKRK